MSGDFDPRTLWTRRQMTVAMGAVAAVSVSGPGAFASDAEIAGRGGPAPVMIADSGIEGGVARRMAHILGGRLAPLRPEIDPVRFWAAQVAPRLTRKAAVVGVTSWAEYLVLRGLGAERRLRVRFETGQDNKAAGDTAALAALLVEAMAGAGEAAGAGRIGWILA